MHGVVGMLRLMHQLRIWILGELNQIGLETNDCKKGIIFKNFHKPCFTIQYGCNLRQGYLETLPVDAAGKNV